MPEAKRKMDELFASEDRARLMALRTDDPQQNLLERWKKVVKGNPGVAERRLGYVPEIAEHGWAVVALPEEGFAYTIGLKYRFDQPELLVAAPGLSPKDFARVLNLLGAYVAAGNRIGPNEPVDLTDYGTTLVFDTYSNDIFHRYATGLLSTFERYFEDRYHETGDTLPVLWTELARKKPAPKKSTKRAATKKAAAKKPAAKKRAATTKKAAAKKPAAKKTAAKSGRAKQRAARK